MSATLYVIYPRPSDLTEFQRRYELEHLPFAGPRLLGAGATGVKTRKVVQGPAEISWISEVAFPDAATLQACAESKAGKEAMGHATSISSGGAPSFVVAVDP